MLNLPQPLRRFIFLLWLISGFTYKASATHIVGGEMNYRYLGNNVYEIRLTVYRDCFNGIPPFDDPASLGIFNAFNQLVMSVPLTFPGSVIIPPTINSPCFIPPTNICYERTTYQVNVTLPPSANGYQLAYQRCCRNITIANIIAPDATGATYYASIPGTNTFSQNSNPVFNNWPPPFICQGIPFIFDHSATDPDGDSIVYEICTPFIGADTLDPMPQPPNAPPYASVIYKPPYSNSNVLGGVPMIINPNTGLITALPNTVGQFVVGICAKEYRNGIYLSTTKRDFQLNVVPCPSLIVAAMQYPLYTCGSFTVNFQNTSMNASYFKWDFGAPGNADTSTAFSPSFTFPDTGVYQVTLIAISSLDTTCADTITGPVTILPDFIPDFSYTLDTCSNTFSFRDTSNSESGHIITRFWNFGDGSTSTDSLPQHVFAAGSYTVTLSAVSSKGCEDSIGKAIIADPLLSVGVTADNVRCRDECNGSISTNTQGGHAPYFYQWNDPLNQTTPVADSLCPAAYQVIVTDINGCSDTLGTTITEPDSLRLSVNVTPAYCSGSCIGSGEAIVSGGNGGYQFQWNDPQQQTTSTAGGLCEGNYHVTVTDARGCNMDASITVLYSDSLPSIEAFADTNFLFEGQGTYLHAIPVTGNSIVWQPSSPLNNNTIADPYATPLVTTTFQVTITDRNQCTNSDTVTIFLKEVLCSEPELFVPTAFSPDNDGVNDLFRLRGNTLTSLHMEIYDRWGERMFVTDDIMKGWDGNYKNEPASPGVYVYYLTATCYDQSEFKKKGNVTLLR